MKKLFALLTLLSKNQIYYCFQSYSEVYCLCVEDVTGENHNISCENPLDVYKELKVIWGHLEKPRSIPLPHIEQSGRILLPKPPGIK